MGERDPLEPAATFVKVVATLLLLSLALLAVAAVRGSGANAFGFGDYNICADMRAGGVPMTMPQDGRSGLVVRDARDGVSAYSTEMRLCANSPTDHQRLLSALSQLPSMLVLFAALALALWLIRAARGRGVFTLHVSRRLRQLGWVVLFGGLAASLAEVAARVALIHSMVDGPINGWLTYWQPPSGSTLFLGVALISVARLMRIGATMRGDLDLTV